MPSTRRIAQYIQQLAYESLFKPEEREERPDDAPSAPEKIPNYPTWSATSYLSYVPFRSPTND